ncbi:MAG: LuxR C-terminal-related transcriptional regulator [Comamonas sp.]
MPAKPVLIVTQDNHLWTAWQQLEQWGWQCKRGLSMDDLQHWHSTGNDLAVIDMDLPTLAAMDTRQRLQLWGAMRVLLLSKHLHDDQGRAVLAQGASGYAHAYAPSEMLSRILQSLEEGAIWMGRSLLQRLLKDIDQRLPPEKISADWQQHLSIREKEVAQLASVGQTNAEIGQQLGITERTVRAHLSAVFEKLRVVDRLQLALKVHGIRP